VKQTFTPFMQPKILLADDHSIVRKGLRLICEMSGYADISEVATCNALMRELVRREYTHLVLDMFLTDGNTLEILPTIRNVYPDLKIMIFSMQPAEVYAKATRQLGVWSYISKANPEEETIQILNRFLSNEQPIRRHFGGEDPANPFSYLSTREIEVLHYVLKGVGTKKISDNLNLKHNTVSTFKNRIHEKTRTANLHELVELAKVHKVT
jgi:two-component system, NarL family, invasion response regulator UvrY